MCLNCCNWWLRGRNTQSASLFFNTFSDIICEIYSLMLWNNKAGENTFFPSEPHFFTCLRCNISKYQLLHTVFHFYCQNRKYCLVASWLFIEQCISVIASFQFFHLAPPCKAVVTSSCLGTLLTNCLSIFMLVIRVGFSLSGFVPFLVHTGEYHPEVTFIMYWFTFLMYLCICVLLFHYPCFFLVHRCPLLC